MQEEIMSKSPDEGDAKGNFIPDNLNWGAFGLTPFWLFSNGFWFTLLVYVVLAYVSPWLALLISFIFLFKGTKWSWGGGHRWKSYEQFAESQAAWAIGGFVAIFGTLIYIAIKSAA